MRILSLFEIRWDGTKCFWKQFLYCVKFCVCVFPYDDYVMILSYLLHVRSRWLVCSLWDLGLRSPSLPSCHRWITLRLCVLPDRQLLLCSTRFRIQLLDFNELSKPSSGRAVGSDQKTILILGSRFHYSSGWLNIYPELTQERAALVNRGQWQVEGDAVSGRMEERNCVQEDLGRSIGMLSRVSERVLGKGGSASFKIIWMVKH